MIWNRLQLRIMPSLLLAVCCLFGLFDSIQAQHVLVQSEQQQHFMQPNIDYSPWNPVVDLADYPQESKNNKIRSILSAPPERQFVPKTQFKSRNSNNRADAVKSLNRRNFETSSSQDQNVEKKTLRPAYKRRPLTTSSTTSTPSATTKIESSAGSRFKNYRKNASDVVTAKPRRPFTPRTTSENVLVTASEIPSSTKASQIKKIPVTRGNYRPKSNNKETDGNKDDDENYPEHFKQLLKSKEANTQENEKNVIKKPIKQFRITSTSEKSIKTASSSSKPKNSALFPTRQNRFTTKSSTSSTTSTETSLSSSQSVTVAPKRPLRTRSRPTERAKISIGSTLQEPPTIKQSTPIYATKSPLGQEFETYEERIITQADGLKQIDPPISEYIPRTNSIGSSLSALKYSSRFRISDVASKNGREPSYQATVPTITTTPQLDLNDIDLERWREILPFAAELIQNDGEIMTQSPSQTVSIYEALAEILSKPTESLSFLNNKSTERTLISEAPISSTTTTTTTSTTAPSTTVQTTISSTSFDESTSKVLQNSTKHHDRISELITTENSVNNTEETATNVLTTYIPPTNPDPSQNNSITYTTIIPTTHDISTDFKDDLNTDFSLIDDISINDTTTRSDINDFYENFSIPHVMLINNFTKIETNGNLNETDTFDQIAHSSTNVPKYSIKMPNSTNIPISMTVNNSISSQTKLPKLDLMTRKIGRNYENEMEFQTSSLFPIYKPNFRSESSTEPMKPLMTSTENLLKTTQTTKMTLDMMTSSTTRTNPISSKNPNPTKQSKVVPTTLPSNYQNPLNITLNEIIQFNKYLATPNNKSERVVYAVLSNNTVVRKVIREPKIVADHHIVYGILPNGTIVRKYRNDTSIEITNIDPKSLINPSDDTFKPQNNTRWFKDTTKMNIPKTSTEMTTTKTKMDNGSLIIDLLQKYQNDTDTQVKSQNIFSLAKKTHNNELDHISHSDNEVHNISNVEPEETIKSVSTKMSTNYEERPTTQSTVAAGKVSIYPNGIDSSIATTTKSTTVELSKSTKDSFENEILYDENETNDLKTSTVIAPIYKVTKPVTQTTSSIEASIPPKYTSTISDVPSITINSVIESTPQPSTASSFIEKNFKTLQDLLGNGRETSIIRSSITEPPRDYQPETTEHSILSTTTSQNFIDKNAKTLKELLGSKALTTKLPMTTENIIEKNVKILQNLLGRKQLTTEIPKTTENLVDRNVKALQELLGRKPSTTETPKTTENIVEKNVKILQELLGNTRKSNRIITSTELPKTTENAIENNLKALQEMLGNTRKYNRIVTSTRAPKTTENSIEKDLRALQELIGNSRKATRTVMTSTEVPKTTIEITQPTTTTTTARRKVSTQQSTQKTEVISTTKPIMQTQTIIQPTTQEIATDLTSTSTSMMPQTTLKFTPLKIPSDPVKVLATSTTKNPINNAPFSDTEDIEFLRQLAKYIDRGETTKIVRNSISTTTPSTTRFTTTTSPSTTSSTTKRSTSRIPTTFSDAEDLAFLKNLRQYAGIINLTTERSVLAQKILELALNRSSKSVDTKQMANNKLESMRPAPFTTTQSPESVMSKIANTQKDINMMSAIIDENKNGNVPTKLSPAEIEKTKKMLQKDLVQYNKDLQLLSLLIGRPLNDRDIAKLAATNLGKPKVKDSFIPLPPSIMTTLSIPSTSTTVGTTSIQSSSSTSPIPAFKSLSDSEAKFLQALQQIQTTRTFSTSTSTTTTTTSTSTTPRPIVTQSRPRSQEALIADLLKQQGIGPGNINQIPIDKLIEQLSTDNRINRELAFTPLPTTTIRPFSPMPPLGRQPRPILDGLSWLWRTWQETAPGYQTPPVRSQQRPPVQTFSRPQTSNTNDDLSFDDDQDSQSNGFASNSPLGANGFLGAAIGVTRAVSRFLGVALTGAGQVLQGAFSGGSSASNPQGFGLFGSSRL